MAAREKLEASPLDRVGPLARTFAGRERNPEASRPSV